MKLGAFLVCIAAVGALCAFGLVLSAALYAVVYVAMDGLS